MQRSESRQENDPFGLFAYDNNWMAQSFLLGLELKEGEWHLGTKVLREKGRARLLCRYLEVKIAAPLDRCALSALHQHKPKGSRCSEDGSVPLTRQMVLVFAICHEMT